MVDLLFLPQNFGSVVSLPLTPGGRGRDRERDRGRDGGETGNETWSEIGATQGARRANW